MGEQGELRTLREWAPMTHLLQQIPLKAQKGLFTHDLNLTCVDCLSDFLVLGTNLGLIYWYDRRKDKLQRLRCENSTSPIVCVRVVSTVDYMIAAGSEDGNVTVFQIPRPVPDVAPPSLNSKQNRQIERFSIGGLHASPVTSLEWSPNGMSLFSGDKLGIIVLTEIDFYMHLSKSREIINEKYEVVQLSYHSSTGAPHGKLLLVSTTYRTTVCSWRQEDRTWKVSQLGQRERKTLGPFGATFFHPLGIEIASHRDIIFASRPGLRLWQAGLDGIVQQTLIFKDALMCPHPSIMLVNPVPSRFKIAKVVNGKNKGRRAASKTEEEGAEGVYQHQLGYLHSFAGGFLVAHWKGPCGSILVLDPEDTGVIASVKTGPGGLRSIISVAVSSASSKPMHNNLDNNTVEQGPEIFVLEGSRSLIRIAYSPDYNYSKESEELDESLSSSFRSLFTSSIFPSSLPSPPPLLRDLTSSLLEFTSGSGMRSSKPGEHSGTSSDHDTGNIASSSDGEAALPKEKKLGNDNIVMADEALEIPPIVGLPFETIPDVKMTTPPPPEALPKKSSSIEKKASENVTYGLQQKLNDEVLYKPKKKKEKRKKSCTKAPPQSFLDPGGGVSEDSSSPSMSRSEDDTSQLVQADAAAVTKETEKSMHSSCPPPGSEGERSSQSEKGSKVLNLDGKKKVRVERRKKSEVVTSVSLRSSIVEEGHVGGMEAWLPSMPLAPDLRSPTSIRQDVESKGELLAKLLDLKPILPQPMPKIEANSCTVSEKSPSVHSERSFALKVTDSPIVDDSCEAPSVLLETSVKIGEAEMVTRQSIEREMLNQRVKTEEEMMEKETFGRNRAYSLDSDWEVISD